MIMKNFKFGLFFMAIIFAFASCSETGKRDAQKIIDKVSHEGELKGYRSVYVVDFDNQSYYVDNNDNEELLQYPIYRNDDGSYTIVYDDEDYTLYELNEPIDLFRNGITLLRYRFCDNNHFIADIPKSI